VIVGAAAYRLRHRGGRAALGDHMTAALDADDDNDGDYRLPGRAARCPGRRPPTTTPLNSTMTTRDDDHGDDDLDEVADEWDDLMRR
jgi:hypothetical protein